MKLILATTAALMLTVPAAFAGDGGQAVKETNQILHSIGTNLGQFKKALGKPKLGPIVSDLNNG